MCQADYAEKTLDPGAAVPQYLVGISLPQRGSAYSIYVKMVTQDAEKATKKLETKCSLGKIPTEARLLGRKCRRGRAHIG